MKTWYQISLTGESPVISDFIIRYDVESKHHLEEFGIVFIELSEDELLQFKLICLDYIDGMALALPNLVNMKEIYT